MYNDTRNEMQLRVLSGLHRYPELFDSTPAYLCGDEPWLTVRKALEAYHAGKVGTMQLLQGMLKKYGWIHFEALLDVLDNSEAVPRKSWAETQIRIFRESLERAYAREDRNAA